MTLPLIDIRREEVDAPTAATWEALVERSPDGGSNRAGPLFARLLGCDSVEVSGEPGATGSTVPGFRVTRSQPPRELSLAGKHRFSEYTLDFRIDDHGDGGSVLSAITHAAFPGLKGQLYKTAVIRSRAHVLATKRMLRSIARRTERARLKR